LFCAVFLLSPAFAVKKGYHLGTPVTFKTSDGMIISGLFCPAAGSRVKTFILLHGLGSDQDEWQKFAGKLVARGYGFLSYDARGHGKSTLTADGKQVSYQDFGAPGPKSQWNRMITDLGDAVMFLANEKKVRANNIGIIGASVGANVALIYSATNEAIPVVVLLSPGINYAGFGTLDAIQWFHKRPIAIAASQGDTYAFQSSQLLFQQIQENRRANLMPAEKGHGVEMFGGKFDKVLLRWLAKN
jgi:alpha-beta hydrolase superfamily lysophospholipase